MPTVDMLCVHTLRRYHTVSRKIHCTVSRVSVNTEEGICLKVRTPKGRIAEISCVCEIAGQMPNSTSATGSHLLHSGLHGENYQRITRNCNVG